MKAKLTKTLLESTPPQARDVVIWDTLVPSLFAKITPSGKIGYHFQARLPNGREWKKKIGGHGAIVVDEARQIARQWHAEIASGTDIGAERRALREAATVTQLAERYLEDYAEVHKKPRSVASDRANIENHVLPLIGKMLVQDLTRADIHNVMTSVANGRTARRLQAKARGRRVVRGGKGVANRVMALLSKMLNCAIEWGMIENNPARGIRKYRENRKDRFLDSDEVGRLIVALDQAEVQRTEPLVVIVAIRILLFTGMRYGEVVELKWRNVDHEHGCFRLADSKTGKRVIPFGSQVRFALAKLSKGEPDAFVFEGRKPGTMVSLRRPWACIRERADIDATATLHTLRHTFASWSVMGGLSLSQVGSLLGHKSTQTTLRYADHAVDALRSYSEHTGDILAKLGSGENWRSPTNGL